MRNASSWTASTFTKFFCTSKLVESPQKASEFVTASTIMHCLDVASFPG